MIIWRPARLDSSGAVTVGTAIPIQLPVEDLIGNRNNNKYESSSSRSILNAQVKTSCLRNIVNKRTFLSFERRP